MKAWRVHAYGEPETMPFEEIPPPEPGPNQVRIRNRAAGLNFFDILQVQGKYQVKPPFPFTIGAEVAGVVDAAGPGVTAFAPGDRVLSLTEGGGFAEYTMEIVKVVGREILDSRGNPTVEADVTSPTEASAAPPFPPAHPPASTKRSSFATAIPKRYLGKGTLKGRQEYRQEIAIDRKMIELDGTPNKSNLGANAILAVSMAVARARRIAADAALSLSGRRRLHCCRCR
jgi:hypothetical protein